MWVKTNKNKKKKEWFKMPFLHSVRNCKVHRGVNLHKKKLNIF